MGVRAVFVVVIAAWLASCGMTSAEREAILNSWLGKPESRLVAGWGPPDSVYVSPDGATRILTFERVTQITTPGRPPTYRTRPDGSVVSTPGWPDQTSTLRCKTSFTIVNDRITTWRQEGNAC